MAAQPGQQDAVTVRQFRDLEAYLNELENRLAPLTGRGDIDPVPVLDPVIWTEMTLTDSTIQQIDGVYWASIRLSLSGANANSWVQLRMTWGGVEGVPPGERVGLQVDIGRTDQAQVTLSGTIAIGVNLQFWIRGDSASLLGGVISTHRIGTGDIIRGQL